MTTDELVTLLEAVIGPDVSVREAVVTYDGLNDESLALLVRFVAGERPSEPAGPTVGAGFEPAWPSREEPRPPREPKVPEWQERLAEQMPNRSDVEDEDGNLPLEGAFDGVTLP